MRKEHESIAYATEEALIGRVIYEALSLSNEIKATRVDYYKVVLKIKDSKGSNGIVSTLLNQFKRKPVVIRAKRSNKEQLKTKKEKFFEITIKTKNDFEEYIQTQSDAYKNFDKISSTIQPLLHTKQRDNIHRFLIHIGYLPAASNGEDEPTSTHNIIVTALSFFDDKNDFLAFSEYLWGSKTGSLFGFDFNQIENIWEKRKLWGKTIR